MSKSLSSLLLALCFAMQGSRLSHFLPLVEFSLVSLCCEHRFSFLYAKCLVVDY